jgi:hypothetical protein
MTVEYIIASYGSTLMLYLAIASLVYGVTLAAVAKEEELSGSEIVAWAVSVPCLLGFLILYGLSFMPKAGSRDIWMNMCLWVAVLEVPVAAALTTHNKYIQSTTTDDVASEVTTIENATWVTTIVAWCLWGFLVYLARKERKSV